MLKNKEKILVILGTTASGKTSLGVKLADKYNGEIIGADSRQVYKGMDVGTGKDLHEYKMGKKKIPYHLIDVVKPNTKFNLAKYQKLTIKAIDDILKRGKLPIIVGGTGLYLQAIVDNYQLSNAKPNQERRKELEKLSAEELFKILKKTKPSFASKINNSDRNNARRLVRYVEIIEQGNIGVEGKKESPYDFLLLGLEWPDNELRKRIEYRLLTRLENEGMIAETKRLNNEGVSWKRLISFGLEYKFIAWHLQGKMNYSEMVEKLGIATYRFAKKQKSWFKRWEKQGRKIEWIKDNPEAEKKIDKWL